MTWACDHCGQPEEFCVLCGDCERLVCCDCGRVECCCAPRAPSVRVQRAFESDSALARLTVLVAAAFEDDA